MEVGIAEEHLLGEVLIHVWRIGFQLFNHLVLVRCPFLGQHLATQHDKKCDVECEQISDNAEEFRSFTEFHGSPQYVVECYCNMTKPENGNK